MTPDEHSGQSKGKPRFSGLVESSSPTVDPREFAPDLLRIEHTPPRPLPRAALLLALALVSAALLWAAFSRLDVVAVAQGKLVPKSYIKIVQPSEAGIVREILVDQGDYVQEGQVLLRLDPTLAAADLESLEIEYHRKLLAQRRIDAELLDEPFLEVPGDDPEVLAEVLAEYRANRASLEAALAEERSAREQSKNQLAAAREIKHKLEKVVPLYRTEDATYTKLADQGYVGRLAAGEKARERIEKEEELKTQEHVISREQAALEQAERRLARIRSDYNKRLREERAEVALRLKTLYQEISKQNHRLELLELRAPQDGVIKSLGTHTLGTVTQPGTILMTLVPSEEPLYAEVWLDNKDVGFVAKGLETKIKLETFRFQKYGMLTGRVEHVAADAEERAEDRPNSARPGGLAYRTLVDLPSQILEVDDRSYRLLPGMRVTAEIKLGTRTVLEYLLSPVRKAFHEGGRER